MTDGNAEFAEASFTVTVTPVNDVPSFLKGADGAFGRPQVWIMDTDRWQATSNSGRALREIAADRTTWLFAIFAHVFRSRL